MSKRLVPLLALLVTGLALACNGGGEPSRTGTPATSSATASPSGRAPATTPPQAEYPPKVSLTEPGAYLIRSDGSGLRRLASGEGRYRSSWSPDGSHIAVVGIVGGVHLVSVIDVDGGTEVTVFDGTGRGPEWWVGMPLWSPDGRQLAVPAGPYDDTAGWHTCLVSADGSGEPNELFEGWPLGWSPDGNALAFVEYSEKGVTLQTFDLATRTATVIERGIALNSFAWSPDGERMAYSIQPRLATFEEVVIIDRDGWDRRVMAERGAYPQWSPDGNYVTFIDRDGWVTLAPVNTSADPARLSPGGVAGWSPKGDAVVIWDMWSLKRVSLATHETIETIDLAGHVLAGVGRLCLSPDGERVVFTVSDPQKQVPDALFVMNIDGTGLQKLLELSTGIPWGPDWSPDGRYIAFVDGMTGIS